MKRYLLYIALSVITLLVCFSITPGIHADPNEPNSVGEPNSIADPNDFTDPNIAAAAVVADSNQDVPTIIEAIKSIEPDVRPDEPNEPNSIAAVAPVEKKRPRAVSISISPAIDLPEFKYRLLPLDMEKDDGDAGERYLKAIDTLAADFSNSAVKDLLDTPMDKFNANSAESIIKSSAKSLEFIRQGGLLRQCQWSNKPADKNAFLLLKGLNSLTSLVALNTRLDISRGEYKRAVESIRDGLAMSRHIANTASMVQAIAAANTASVMLKSVEQLVQASQAPSLYRSLGDLPKPLVNLNNTMALATAKYYAELAESNRDEFSNPLEGFDFNNFDKDEFKIVFEQMRYESLNPKPKKKVDKPFYSRKDIILQMNKLDRLVAALQCLEGIRYYAAVNDGKLPESLGDISDLPLPLDPVTQRPFRYVLGKDIALLGSPVTRKQADFEGTIYFEILTNE